MWKPIVVGVDMSPQAAWAAAFAWRIAKAADAECYFVHGTRPLFHTPSELEFVADVNLLIERQLESTRDGIIATLKGSVPADALSRLDIRLGRGAAVLTDAARERKAGLIVVGGKHHSLLGRWMGGSTGHHVVRTTDIPLLVTGDTTSGIRRILVAVDLSYALQPTVEVALRFSRLFNAEVRLLHAVEPLPMIAELPPMLDEQAFYRDSLEQLERSLESSPETAGLERVVRRGRAADVIAIEVGDWAADLVVVGSHGKGWVDRLLVGSTTERLLDQLPTSLLVTPVPAPPDQTERSVAGARGRARKTLSRSTQVF